MSTIYDTIVIGAGQAGLAAGYHLQRAGLRFLILEASEEPAGLYYVDLPRQRNAASVSLRGVGR